MSNPSIVGFSGNFTRPSKTRAFVETVANDIARRQGLSAAIYDVADLGASFRAANWSSDLDKGASQILSQVAAADLLVVGSPTYKGSYTGLFKHFFDLLDPAALRGKPILLTATGGGPRHALVVEHQLRPLFGFFEAFALPTAVYAVDSDFSDGTLVSEAVIARAAQAIGEAGRLIHTGTALDVAAE